MSIGDLCDSLITINLKLNARLNKIGKEQECQILREQVIYLEKELTQKIKKLFKAPHKVPDLSKMKVYSSEFVIKEVSSVGEAITELVKTVNELWDLQSFINEEKYLHGTQQDVIAYIKDLNRLNKHRNYNIDQVNKKFKELANEKYISHRK